MARRNDHSFPGWMKETTERLTLLERRVVRLGDGGGGGGRYGVFNDPSPNASKAPNAYQFGYTIAEIGALPAGFPANDALVETYYMPDTRGFQRVTQRTSPYQTWQRGSASAGAAWGGWVLTGGDTGWLDLTAATGWSSNQLAYRVKSGTVEIKGEVWGGADSSTVFTMPADARPATRRSAMATRIAASSGIWGNLVMQTNGVVAFYNLGSTMPPGSPGYGVGPLGGYSTD